MNPHFRTLCRAAGAALLLLTLGACAYAPGMRFDASLPVDPADPNSTPVVKILTPTLVMDDLRQREQFADNAYRALVGKATQYTIGPGDILSVVIWDHPELVLPTQTYSIGTGPAAVTVGDAAAGIPGYPVSDDGYIQFPYVGRLKVAGLTEDQARLALTRRIGGFIQEPQVTIRVLGYRSQRVYVDGEVKTPGAVAMTDVPMTLSQAINQAGGALATGDRSRIYVTRAGQRIRVDMTALERRGIDANTLFLRSGDSVRVTPSSENQVYVMGEVTKPLAMPLRDGALTLTDALGEAGGPSQLTADGSKVFVVRSTETAMPLVYHLDASSPSALAVGAKFQLEPKDVVFVDAGNLVRWNRFISLLFPSAQTVQTVGSVR